MLTHLHVGCGFDNICYLFCVLNQNLFEFLLSKLATYKKALYKQGLNHLLLLRKYILLLRNKRDLAHCKCLLHYFYDKYVYQISCSHQYAH